MGVWYNKLLIVFLVERVDHGRTYTYQTFRRTSPTFDPRPGILGSFFMRWFFDFVTSRPQLPKPAINWLAKAPRSSLNRLTVFVPLIICHIICHYTGIIIIIIIWLYYSAWISVCKVIKILYYKKRKGSVEVAHFFNIISKTLEHGILFTLKYMVSDE